MPSDPAQPHPLASFRAAPVLADARRETGGKEGDLQCCITTQLHCSTVTRKKPQCLLKGRGRRGGESIALPHAEARQDGGEHAPRSNLCPSRGLGRGDKRPGEAWPRPLVALAQQLLSTFVSYRYTCASALPRLHFAITARPTETKRCPRSAPTPQTPMKTRPFSASSCPQLLLINH